ncbi:hypothetical protein SAMN06265795_11416 [Noviherbaspirillum humi]|uniref:Uncharacterized protein n=1 Tax=Noviherbaspirillum humi TaxID=1688639 RepID=A0A239JWY6_9BURK|nr:hypothetical protein [Noviherbaspirillum humi]SNT10325.1 hypothetical protein SAMN06265795_11416 [Noviherbaspirillum humi]
MSKSPLPFLTVLSGIQSGVGLELAADDNYIIGAQPHDDVILRDAGDGRALVRICPAEEALPERLFITAILGNVSVNGDTLAIGMSRELPLPVWLTVGDVTLGIGIGIEQDAWAGIVAGGPSGEVLSKRQFFGRRAVAVIATSALALMLAAGAVYWHQSQNPDTSQISLSKPERARQKLLEKLPQEVKKRLLIDVTPQGELVVSGYVADDAVEAGIRRAAAASALRVNVRIHNAQQVAAELSAQLLKLGIAEPVRPDGAGGYAITLASAQWPAVRERLAKWDGDKTALREVVFDFTDAWDKDSGKLLSARFNADGPADETSREIAIHLPQATLAERYRRIVRLQTQPSQALVLQNGERVLVGAHLGNDVYLHQVVSGAVMLRRGPVLRAYPLR